MHNKNQMLPEKDTLKRVLESMKSIFVLVLHFNVIKIPIRHVDFPKTLTPLGPMSMTQQPR